MNDRPGYKPAKNNDGTIRHYWIANRASSKAPAAYPNVRLPDKITDTEIDRLCQDYTDQLLAEIDSMSQPTIFDGRISSLVTLYRTDPNSPYRKLKASTRIRDYDHALRLIEKTVGERQICRLIGSDFDRWFELWKESKGHRTAHSAIRKLRAVLTYGVQSRLSGCSETREILSVMKFEMPPARLTRLEYEHALAVCMTALEQGRPSIAITQAIQWDTALRRIHIIGEWVPVTPGETGAFIRGQTRWQGPTMKDIKDGVFTPPNQSKQKRATSHDLANCHLLQMVLERTSLPEIGPLVVSEKTNLPYRSNYYSNDWRIIARIAGVPDNIWSMDTRAGGITEAEQVAGLTAAQKLAGHTNPKTTAGYVRDDNLENNRMVADLRARARK